MNKLRIKILDYRESIGDLRGWHWEIWWDGALIEESVRPHTSRKAARMAAILRAEEIANAILRKTAKIKARASR